jgi:hypothetical protein
LERPNLFEGNSYLNILFLTFSPKDLFLNTRWKSIS